MPMLYSFLRALVAFVLLMAVLRLVGGKTISQMNFFDFGVAVTLGSVTANLAIGNNHNELAVAVILVSFGLIVLLADYLHIKSYRFRKLINSEPLTIIENGQLNDKNMRKSRLTIDELNAVLRQKTIFNMADVEFAVLEIDGKLSVLPKSQKQPLTPADLNIPTTYNGLTADLILDGNIMNENLSSVSLDENWLKNELKTQGIGNYRDVFYAGLDTSGKLYISLKHKS